MFVSWGFHSILGLISLGHISLFHTMNKENEINSLFTFAIQRNSELKPSKYLI